MGWPLAESEDYETIAGWVLSMLDTVPQMGYSFEKDGYRFTIHAMRRRRILAVRVERISDDALQASDGKAGQETSYEKSSSLSKTFLTQRIIGIAL